MNDDGATFSVDSLVMTDRVGKLYRVLRYTLDTPLEPAQPGTPGTSSKRRRVKRKAHYRLAGGRSIFEHEDGTFRTIDGKLILTLAGDDA